MPHPVNAGVADLPVFAERLDAGPPGESEADAEARVRLDLEVNAPLSPERLAYGWVRLAAGDIVYYALPLDRLPPHEDAAPAGSVVPDWDRLLLPDGVSAEEMRARATGAAADLRPREVLRLLAGRAATDRLVARVAWPLRITLALAVLLLAAAAVLHARAAWAARRLADDGDRIRSAESRADALATLERLSDGGRSVFDALAVLNAHRPEAVSFSRVTFADSRELLIEGRAAGVADINRMADALRATGHFGVVETPKLDTSRGRSTFRMRLVITNWPKIADAPVAAPAAAAPAPTSAPAAS